MKRFMAKWDTFKTEVCRLDMSPTEIENYRRCFYAGAIACMALMETTDLSTPDEGMAQMRDLVTELQDFSLEMRDERKVESKREFAPRRKEF